MAFRYLPRLLYASIYAWLFNTDFYIEYTATRTQDIKLSEQATLGPTGELHVYALPVGQGDCTIIQCPNGNIVVVDCGSRGGEPRRLSTDQIKNFLNGHVKKVVAIIITHPDIDHYNYLDKIIQEEDTEYIKEVIIGGKLNDYVAIKNWLTTYFHSKEKLYTVNDGKRCIGDCKVPKGTNFCEDKNINFDILAANVGKKNEISIVMKVTVGDWSMLLPGDMEGQAATDIAKGLGKKLKSVVYKVAHHGASREANKEDWLKEIQPKQAFVSSGYNCNYCHPRCDTVKRMEVLRTLEKTKSHDIYCAEEKKGPSPTFKVDYSLFETTPSSNKICLLHYKSSRKNEHICWTLGHDEL